MPRLAARRRVRLALQPRPPEWADWLDRAVPVVRRMPAPARARLAGLVRVFLAEKNFVGCNGVTVDDRMAVVIAAQACVLVLARPGVPERGLYPQLRSILVYPEEFLVHEEHEDDDGLVTTGHRVLSGQAWDASRIILSWADVADAGDGYNVVLHEFAHYLDVEDDITMRAFEEDETESAWGRTLREEFDRLTAEVDAGMATFLDPYAATDPSEFFAVATEAFFDQSAEFAARHPALYRRLVEYYRLDPANWSSAA